METLKLIFNAPPADEARLVFGETPDVPAPPPDLRTRLVFNQPAATGLPARLVFGAVDDGTPPPEPVTVTLDGSGSITGLRLRVDLLSGVVKLSGAGTITGLRLHIATTFDINVSRPTVGGARSVWQDAAPLPHAARSTWQQSAPLPMGTRSQWQDAAAVAASVRERWQDTQRLQRAVRNAFEQAIRLPAVPLRSSFQEAQRLHTSARADFQEAIRLPAAGLRVRFEETLRDRQARIGARFEVATPVAVPIASGMGIAVRLPRGWGGRFQQAWPPRPGKWQRPGPPGPGDPCYVPELPARLVFTAPFDASLPARLVFVCERHGPGPDPEPGETIVVPVRRVYVVINEARLRRVGGDIQIPTFTMSMSLDADSWTWSFSASVPGYALADVEPEDGAPVAVQATINGTAYRFIVESISRERVFGRNDLRIGGRGRAAVLDAPYAPIMSFRNTGARTAQQIVNDILTDNGVPLGWEVEWNPDDWNVPAGVFAHQGSYITALNQVAGSIAAYLQPHNTDETLRVLSRYPVAPWDWGDVTPDFELPSAVTTREGIEWVNKARYNRVYVMGQQTGVNGRVTREGTAGDYLAPSVVDPLITEAVAARQRGRAVLSDTGRIASVSLRLPVLAETGIIKPGNFVRYTDGGTVRIGITRSVQVEVGLPAIWQTLGVETHVEPV